jgi:hypothetical protein
MKTPAKKQFIALFGLIGNSMPKRIAFSAILFGSSILIVGVIMFNRNFNAEGANPRIHKNELPEYGLLIVGSADDTYENDVKELLQEKNAAYQEVARTLKPFSVFIKNTSSRDILAYKLNWELKMSDGRIVNYPRTYFAPDYLMGVPRSDLYDSAMQTIKKNNKRFFTMIPTPFETDGGSRGAAAVKIGKEEVERFQEVGRTGDITPFIAKIAEKVTQATDVTVSIESVLFDDGAFVGPPGDQEFVKLKASITAKYDLLKAIATSLNKEKTPLTEVFTEVSGIADKDVPMPIYTSGFEDYYNYFRKRQAQEIMSSRQALGDDTKVINIFLQRLDHKWIIPFEQNTTLSKNLDPKENNAYPVME